MTDFTWPVSSFEIKGLFNDRNLSIEFPDDRRIYFLYGDNGVGKTTAMSILDAILNLREEDLITVEFASATVWFKDGSSLRVLSKTEEIGVLSRPGQSSKTKEFIEVPVVDFQFRRSELEEFASIPKKDLSRWSFPGFSDFDEIEYFKEMANKIILSNNLDRTAVMALTRWLRDKYVEEESVVEDQSIQGFLSKVPVRSSLIRADRLQKEVVVGQRRSMRTSLQERGFSSTKLETSIETNSLRMKNLIAHDIQQSFKVSTEVDREFPERVIRVLESGKKLEQVNFDDLIHKVYELQNKISQAGIFVKSSSELHDYVNIEDVLTRSVVSLFYQGTIKKLQGLEPLANKINLFKQLVNSKITGKILDVNLEGYEVRNRNGKLLPLDSLSSGEQHQIVLLFDLIFTGNYGNSLYLIDEPELSLHVSWQEQFASDLELISALNGGSFLLATHSPVIVNENWDAMVSFNMELKDQ